MATKRNSKSKADISGIDVGDWVKGAFGTEDVQEHMWVRVTKVTHQAIEGELDNVPEVVDMKLGDHVKMGPSQVEDVMKQNPARKTGRLPASLQVNA